VPCRPAAGQVPVVFAHAAAPLAVAAAHCDAFIEHAAPAVAGQFDAVDVIIMPVAPRAKAPRAKAPRTEVPRADAPCAIDRRTTPTTNRLTIMAPAATFFIRVFMMHTSFRN
jgi:hypothetical protein